MQKVLGIGGVFFRARNPEALGAWYRDHLGIDPVPSSPDMTPWTAQGGATVFSPFAQDTDYFPSGQQFMINFRVKDLDAMVSQLDLAGIQVYNQQNLEGIGRFAHLRDPEGTPIELWEPVPAGDSE